MIEEMTNIYTEHAICIVVQYENSCFLKINESISDIFQIYTAEKSLADAKTVYFKFIHCKVIIFMYMYIFFLYLVQINFILSYLKFKKLFLNKGINL